MALPLSRAQRIALVALSSASFLWAGCECGTPPRPPLDAGAIDAPPGPDAPFPFDALGLDAPLEDGALPSVDGGDAGPGITCTFDPTQLLELARDPIDAARVVGVAAGATEWGVTWTQSADGFQNVWWVPVGATGFPTATQATSTLALQQQPTIASSGDGWVLAWYGNPDGDFEIYSRAYDASGAARGLASNRVTMRAMRDDNPVLLGLGSTVLLAFAQSEGVMSRLAVTRVLSSSAVPMGTAAVVTGATTVVPQPVLARRLDGAVLGWVDSSSAAPTAYLMPLDGAGAGAGPAVALSTEGNADGSLDLATTADLGGAAAFGVTVGGARPEVRGRLIAPDGSPSGPERVLTPAPEAARDASIARFSGGYVLAYRGVEGATPMLRVALLGVSLERVATFDLVPVAATGGRVTVRVTNEGRILIAWADVIDPTTGTDIRALRLTCD